MTPAAAMLALAALWLSEDAGSAAPDAGPDSPTPPELTPGEPARDGTLPAGVLVVELVDARGAPLPRATVFIEATSAGGQHKRLTTETDAEGRVRVEDLPRGGPHQLRVGHTSEGGLLAASQPFQLAPQHGSRLRLVVPERTERADSVSIEQLHVVLDREGALVRVTETVGLASRGDSVFTNPRGLLLPLPEGASGPRLADVDKIRDQAAVTDDGFLVTAPIPAAGLELTLVFQVPIEGGRARFEQSFPAPVSSAQFISTWTAGDASLAVAGLAPAETAQLQNGLTALVVMGHDLSRKRFAVALTGIEDGPARTRRIVAFAVSALLLLAGLVLWIRRRARAGDREGEQQ